MERRMNEKFLSPRLRQETVTSRLGCRCVFEAKDDAKRETLGFDQFPSVPILINPTFWCVLWKRRRINAV
jgi:hypothetical protein